MEIQIYDINGKKLDTFDFKLPEIKLSDAELSQIIRVYETNLHQGTKSAKTKGEVVYSKRKPWRQKGTGRARAGHKGSPIWVGGGVAHGPKPYTTRLSVNKKQKIRALAYILNELGESGKIFAINPGDLDKPLVTKQGVAFLREIGLLPFKIIFVPSIQEEYAVTGFRNIRNVLVRRAELISPFDLFRNRPLVLTIKSLEVIKSRILRNE